MFVLLTVCVRGAPLCVYIRYVRMQEECVNGVRNTYVYDIMNRDLRCWVGCMEREGLDLKLGWMDRKGVAW